MKGYVTVTAGFVTQTGKWREASAMINFDGNTVDLHNLCKAEKHRYASRGYDQVLTTFTKDGEQHFSVIQTD